ncbi:MAG: sensor histidine kinase [Bacteroidota bacterium]
MDSTSDDQAPHPNADSPSRPASPAAVERPPLGEDSFRRVVEWAPSAMVMINRKGVIVLVNSQAIQMFDYRREEMIGKSIEMLVPERFRDKHQAYRGGFFHDPQPRPMGIGRDLFASRADGTEFPVEIGLNPIDTEAGPMVLASIVDITERRRIREHLENALLEKTVLLNEIHHRVKNNLQVITSLLNLQADYAADPRLRAVLTESCGRIKAMALTHQLLYERKDFARLDLGDYLDRLVQAIRGTYRAAGGRISLRLELPPDGVHLDLERTIPCGLLVNELVTNSFKHAFPGERRGEIVIELSGSDDDQIDFVVADNGVGLPPDVEVAQTPSLGLQLVQLFVDQLHGVLVIERDGGTKFSMRFPKRLIAKDVPP